MRPKFPSLGIMIFLLSIFPGVCLADRHVSDPQTLRSLSDLVIEANYGLSQTERAAFIIQTAEGRFALDLWPVSHAFRKSVWNGPLPGNAVAIVHTHPPGIPLPSIGDQKESERLGIPIYVLSRTAIYRIDPGSRESVRVISQSTWWRDRNNERALWAKQRRDTPRAILATNAPRPVSGPAE